ncbi:MAG: hypothetical protein GKR89_23100 [Candidatus Latescibacteria bacterium]|nr:hypothetical protein [Candidatus Latescibacterota bacterium]
MRKIEPKRIEMAARMYRSNEDASQALGIAPGSFSRLCRLYGIETPYARRRRKRQECRQQKDGFDSFDTELQELEEVLDFQARLG